MNKKLETDRVRALLNSKDKEMRALGQLMLVAHIREYYPTSAEFLEKAQEKTKNEEAYIKACIAQLDEIGLLEGQRVGDSAIDNIKHNINSLKNGGGWGF